MPYYVKIARFMPRVEIVQKNSTNVRRLCIQGDNGKVTHQELINCYCVMLLSLRSILILSSMMLQQPVSVVRRRECYSCLDSSVTVSRKTRLAAACVFDLLCIMVVEFPIGCFLQETCKRHLMFTLPKVVALSPQMRLAEDDVSAISLHDIFKQV